MTCFCNPFFLPLCRQRLTLFFFLVFSQIAVSDVQTFGTMVEGVDRISALITRYAKLESTVLLRTCDLTSQLSSALVKLYGSVLKYLANTCRYYRKSTLSEEPCLCPPHASGLFEFRHKMLIKVTHSLMLVFHREGAEKCSQQHQING